MSRIFGKKRYFYASMRREIILLSHLRKNALLERESEILKKYGRKSHVDCAILCVEKGKLVVIAHCNTGELSVSEWLNRCDFSPKAEFVEFDILGSDPPIRPVTVASKRILIKLQDKASIPCRPGMMGANKLHIRSIRNRRH